MEGSQRLWVLTGAVVGPFWVALVQEGQHAHSSVHAAKGAAEFSKSLQWNLVLGYLELPLPFYSEDWISWALVYPSHKCSLSLKHLFSKRPGNVAVLMFGFILCSTSGSQGCFTHYTVSNFSLPPTSYTQQGVTAKQCSLHDTFVY